jgi:hypothetical protein
MYKNHNKNCHSFGLIMKPSFGISRNVLSLSLVSYRDDIIEEAVKENIKREVFDRLNYFPQYFKILKSRTESMVEHSSKLLNNIEGLKLNLAL